ncbi:hypothetical protein V9T40_013120 [Parthenolecanium corni]|uniref:Uncharacterized protein n=1 Tax=Parthenolecanium corni TaxID=536013 RepID=A0AAN9TN51_9HEMI
MKPRVTRLDRLEQSNKFTNNDAKRRRIENTDANRPPTPECDCVSTRRLELDDEHSQARLFENRDDYSTETSKAGQPHPAPSTPLSTVCKSYQPTPTDYPSAHNLAWIASVRDFGLSTRVRKLAESRKLKAESH